VQLQSLQSVISGGISFSTRHKWKDTPAAPKDTVFKLYNDRQQADTAEMKNIPFVTYFEAPVKNVVPGAPVSMYGIQVGVVTGANLLMDTDTTHMKVRVKFVIQPERLITSRDDYDPLDITRKLVAQGLRVKTGLGIPLLDQGGLSFAFVPDAKQEDVAMEGGAIVVPSSPGGSMDGAMANIADITRKVDQIPFGAIGTNLNNSLEGVNQQSDMQRSVKRTLDQVNDAARSIRLLTDFLSRHPEALIRGRTNKESE
jgi:paraquat-inducible protein B